MSKQEFQRDDPVLELIRCPVTHEPFRVAAPEVLAMINQAIASGSVCNRAGQSVTEPLDAALINRSGTLIAPVRDGIITLLADEMLSADAFDFKLETQDQDEGTS